MDLVFKKQLSKINIMKAKSIKGNSTEEIKTALEQNMADGFKPTLSTFFFPLNKTRNK